MDGTNIPSPLLACAFKCPSPSDFKTPVHYSGNTLDANVAKACISETVPCSIRLTVSSENNSVISIFITTLSKCRRCSFKESSIKPSNRVLPMEAWEE
jgi:hypothetical protein